MARAGARVGRSWFWCSHCGEKTEKETQSMYLGFGITVTHVHCKRCDRRATGNPVGTIVVWEEEEL